jgi:uncharacterized protein (DUF4415 family)
VDDEVSVIDIKRRVERRRFRVLTEHPSFDAGRELTQQPHIGAIAAEYMTSMEDDDADLSANTGKPVDTRQSLQAVSRRLDETVLYVDVQERSGFWQDRLTPAPAIQCS